MTTQVGVYFSHIIDPETHPAIATKKEAIAAVKAMTSNKLTNISYEAEGEGWTLYFTEIVIVEVPDDTECLSYCDEVQNAQPSIKGGECTTARRIK